LTVAGAENLRSRKDPGGGVVRIRCAVKPRPETQSKPLAGARVGDPYPCSDGGRTFAER